MGYFPDISFFISWIELLKSPRNHFCLHDNKIILLWNLSQGFRLDQLSFI
jgi:hypothetical protein